MLKNYFKNNSKSIKKFSLAFRGLVGTLAISTYVANDPKLAFWFLAAGAVIDFLMQLLPPDTELPGGGHKLMFAVGLVCVLSLGSCRIIKPETSHTKTDTTTTNYKKVDVEVKGAKVGTSLNIDSLARVAADKRVKWLLDSAAAAQAGRPIPPAPTEAPKTFTDPNTKAQLTYWIDQHGKLQLGCESKDQTISMLVAEVTKLTTEVSKKTEVVKEIPGYCWAIMGGLAALLLASILFNVVLLKSR